MRSAPSPVGAHAMEVSPENAKRPGWGATLHGVSSCLVRGAGGERELLALAVHVAHLAGRIRTVGLGAVDAVDDRVAVAARAAARLVVDVRAARVIRALARRFALAGPATIGTE